MSSRESALAQALRGPVLLMTLGFLFEMHLNGVLSFSQTWPLLIIVIGIMKFIERAFAPPRVAGMRVAPTPGVPPQYGYATPDVPPQYGYAKPDVPPQYGYARPDVGSIPTARVKPVRSGGSIGGPLILIVIGVAFLAHTISPEVPLATYLARYWPWLLILWGGLQVMEILVRAAHGSWIPDNGISAGGWFLVIFICFFGLASFEFRRAGDWWRRAGFERSVQVFGTEHEYLVNSEKEQAGPSPVVILDSFRGSARIVGTNANEVTAHGHKTIRSLDVGEADRTDKSTPLTIASDGNTIVIRCNQDRADSRTVVTTDLEITVPHGSTLQITDRSGDLDVSSVTGDVDISSGSGGVKLSDVSGGVKVDTRSAESIQCSAIKGPVQLQGHGTDVELENISGQVTISGDYGGTISLRDVQKPIRVESMQTEVNAQQLPGELKIERGSLTGQNLIGPVSVTTKATDVDLSGFTNGLVLNVLGKGDVRLTPLNVPVSKMVVRTRAGNIDLALPESANFHLMADTRRGEIENDFGGDLTETTEGHGARLKGSVGIGPDLNLETTRGTITLRKAAPAEPPERAERPEKKEPPEHSEKPGQIPVGKHVEL